MNVNQDKKLMKMLIKQVLFSGFIFLCVNTLPAQTRIEGLHYIDKTPVSVEIKGDKIISITSIERLTDGSKAVYIAPGLIDIQINGFMGVDFSDPELNKEDIIKAIEALWEHGVTTFLPTLITAGHEQLLRSFRIFARALEDSVISQTIPGLHLEGPYISPDPGYRGAHLEKYIRRPDWDEFQEFQKASKEHIKLITLAPEIEGAIPFIQRCAGTGVVVSLGHHNGNSEIIKSATYAGARLSTHLGNGCANEINRHNNPLWPQLSNESLFISIIADGFHLNSDEIRCFYMIKGAERTILVSDALDLAGLEPGEYIRGERKVILTPDVVTFPAENVLAGAASPVSKGVINIMRFTGCSIGDAIRMASSNPARLLGLNYLGELKPGNRADIILFTPGEKDMEIKKTYVAGKLVYESKKQE